MKLSHYAQQIIDILDRNTANVHDDEFRIYMNEIVIFSLNEAMKGGNDRVKPMDEKGALVMEDAHVVDLRTAINAPTTRPPPRSMLAEPMPDFVDCFTPSMLPAVAPVPAPTQPWETGSIDALRQAA